MFRQDAVRMRHSFKRLTKMETKDEPNAAQLEVRVSLCGDRVDHCFLAFIKDGEVVAMAPISNADLKRIKGDMKFIRQLKSRSAPRVHA